MITKADLKQIATTRLSEARILFQKKNRKYEGAVHLCVCAVELAFKKKICDKLDWKEFPETKSEFEKGFISFKTHNPQILLRLSGEELKIKKNTKAWVNLNILLDLAEKDIFNIEIRYKPKGKVNREQAKEIIKATDILLKFLGIKK